MKIHSNLPRRRLGQRLFSQARALLAVSTLAALAVSTAHADVVFTRNTTTGEHFSHYTVNYTAPYSGNYTLAFNLTAGGPSQDNSIIIDAVKVTNGATTLFADGFESPVLGTNTGVSANGGAATFGSWTFNNYSGILNGSPSSWDLAGPASMPSGSPFTLGSADGTSQYAYLQAAGGTLPKMKATSTLALVAGQTYTVSFYQASRYSFGGTTTYTVTLDIVIPSVIPTAYASGLSPVIGWEPIFLAGPVSQASEDKPVPSVGYNDPRWTNPHAAFVFPLGTHPWENIVPYNFAANWINAWAGNGQLNRNPGLDSNKHGKTTSSPGWAVYPYYGVPDQSFTKYSTTVYGQGEFVLQFLADNVSWIYVDGTLAGYQDSNWGSTGTGRYLISLTGAGAHDLGFVIWDANGLAGGKFRLETRASFELNNPGVPLPPRAATVTLSNLTHTYNGTPKSASVTTAPGSLTTSVTYNGSTTPPTNVGSYNVAATVTTLGYSGSASGTLTISKATATVALANLVHTYDGTVKSATATTVPNGLNVVLNYTGGQINSGNYGVQAIVNDPNYTGSTTGTLVINKATAAITVNGYTGIYDAAAHGATGSATGVGGVALSGLNLGASFTNVPGGTATWTFSGGTNYHDDTGSVAIVINKATATIGVTGYTGIYDAAAHGATGSATGVGGVALSGLNVGASFTNVPGGTATWTFSGGTNYHDATASVAIVINKATATIGVAGYTGIFDAAAHGATGSATGVGGVALSGLNLGASFTNVPGGTATWTFTDVTGNYHDASGTAPITLTKADATIVATGYTGIYDAAAHGATGSATGVGGVALSGLNLGASFTNVPGGTAIWSFTDVTGNYNDASGTAPITVTKADATIVITGYTRVFDAAARGATGSATGMGGVALSGLNLGASFINVPGGTATWSFTDVTGNYKDASASVALVINKATAAITANGYTGVYDAAAHGATGSVTGVGGVALSGLNLGASFTNVPGGSANWTFTDMTGNYLNDSGARAIVITKAIASVVVAPYNVTYNTQPHAATVTSINGVNGETGATVGTVTLNTTHTAAGTYNDSWSFAGATNYQDIASTLIVNTISQAATKTSLGAVPAIQAAGQSVTLTATLVSVAPGAGVPNGMVTFTIGSTVLGTATVDGAGVASLPTTAIPLGPQSVVATYSGSSNFLGSASSALSVLIYAYPAGGGTFVIGDGNSTVGAAVNFWGSQWEKNNSLSGGSSNASFKGFAVSMAGGTFTAAPGNSAPSPASVPAYLGVIVTSKVTKSGSKITGTMVKLVVVKVNPGYAGDPGSPGTGTIVAVVP